MDELQPASKIATGGEMTEKSAIKKIMDALDLAIQAKTGCTLTYFNVIELRGYVKDLEFEYNMISSMMREEQE